MPAMMAQDVREIVESCPHIPTMPTIVSEALTIINNPNSSIGELSQVISKDSSITAQILKLVNSAYYGFPNQITTINQAMALLGFKNVKSLIVSVATKPMLTSLGGKNLWYHSIRCAVGSKMISEELEMGVPDEAFVVGILHDIGKSVMEAYDREKAIRLLKKIREGANELEAEQEIFGFQHTEAGALLAQKWKLPAVISECIKYHHNPLLTDVSLAAIIYVANCLVQDDLSNPIFDPEVMEHLDFDIPDPQDLRQEILETSSIMIGAF